ncbi:MAG: glycine cleavage system aminomethyltransferase GcvT [Alphaproteobacteria bacterium]|nr:glycine cleavage system aminomethyltransferase GcvT [Alphaproteobacteria bacterium]MBU1574175.1 glycine cleavage system aminomethyltransferase GcvT [Alphaproteobacteria bacterium]MBU2077940.1 glycine cleavage system aminomethyltransferase GcvT [Alphaproteobacteria bacterium]MBU2162034.1 glycine cleavage system aminomethyltransferase GcvT [Alphaproteobacteria bacterium]MBU2241264.1 glycine cleavage system aminomethyltransferase GcvT [Alphaproteobacteria bacterium]
MSEMTGLKRTPLYDFHIEQGGKMVPFAGYDMPVQYPLGVMKEHLHTRAEAGLFDVSHMGQVMLTSPEGVEALGLALETLVPVDVLAVKPGRQRYGVFTNDAGGILDDLMISNAGDGLFLVVNAACKQDDIAHLIAHLPDHVTVTEITDRALLALQGPKAEAVLARIVPQVAEMRFMDSLRIAVGGSEWWISRSGYTGEDGFEISVPAGEAVDFAKTLVAMDAVELIGLGARDSLRLEAGLCLYGHDIDATTSPVEGNIAWAMQKTRRVGGAREGGFPGADRILRELTDGAVKMRVGLLPQGRAPMRDGTPLFATSESADQIGVITSGGFGPSVERPIAMGYLPAEFTKTGTEIYAELRGKRLPVTVADMPFRPSTYKR